MEIYPDARGAGGREEKGEQAATNLGLSDTYLRASLAEADVFSSIYATIHPRSFQN